MEFDLNQFVWTIITFFCLMAVLSRFAFKPLQKVLEARENSIKESLDKAEQAGKEAELARAENEKLLEQARGEARKIINEGHRIVADMRRESTDKARTEAEQIVSQARREVNQELQRGMSDLKSTVANLSVRIAGQVIREELNEQRHQKLADNFVERLKKSHASNPKS